MKQQLRDEKEMFISLKPAAEMAAGGYSFSEFEIIGTTFKDVTGINGTIGTKYWVKVRHSSESYLHMKVFWPLNDDERQPAEIKEVIMGQMVDNPFPFFE